jgi:hypothetical protein
MWGLYGAYAGPSRANGLIRKTDINSFSHTQLSVVGR